jgi:hypothetical protein
VGESKSFILKPVTININMKQPYQWPDINLLNESTWKAYDWPSTVELTEVDYANFDKKYPGRHADFNFFVYEDRVAPSFN